MMGTLFDDVDEIIDRCLKVSEIAESRSHHKSRGGCNRLSCTPEDINASKMFQKILERMENELGTLDRSKGKRQSTKNWRFQPQPKISDTNPSLEKRLEKMIVSRKHRDVDWANQIPTASGIFYSKKDGKRCVDLGHRVEPGVFELIELKIKRDKSKSDTPLHAMREIVQYGLLYVLARRHPERYPEQELLKARKVHLEVLAPREFYCGYNLGWLEEDLNQGLSKFLDPLHLDLSMDFCSKVFPDEFCRFLKLQDWFIREEAVDRVRAAVKNLERYQWAETDHCESK